MVRPVAVVLLASIALACASGPDARSLPDPSVTDPGATAAPGPTEDATSSDTLAVCTRSPDGEACWATLTDQFSEQIDGRIAELTEAWNERVCDGDPCDGYGQLLLDARAAADELEGSLCGGAAMGAGYSTSAEVRLECESQVLTAFLELLSSDLLIGNPGGTDDESGDRSETTDPAGPPRRDESGAPSTTTP